jgi:hypothetical protein
MRNMNCSAYDLYNQYFAKSSLTMYDYVVLLVPTGAQRKKREDIFPDYLVKYTFPYSEHCSYSVC